jgi:hypothetical protein
MKGTKMIDFVLKGDRVLSSHSQIPRNVKKCFFFFLKENFAKKICSSTKRTILN